MAAFAFCGARSAHAQQLPAAEEAAVEPPRLKGDSGAAYPEQALRDHVDQPVVVVLVLDVDAGGAVRHATVETPRGHGFDEAAVAAAQSLVFEPATRDGTPVAARIKFRYTFTPPAPRLVGRIATQSGDAPIAGATVTVRDAAGADHLVTTAADGSFAVPGLGAGRVRVTATAPGRTEEAIDDTLAVGEETTVVLRLAPVAVAGSNDAGPHGADVVEDVTVKGARAREVTKRTLGREEIAHAPGTHGDALLSLQNLPGVARAPPLSGALIVRGSAPGDTNIFIDGTNVPLIYHFGGLASVVPTELLQSVDLFPGNYGAEYGRGMGGVVDVGLRDPNKTHYHALAQVDILSARALVEGPIAGGWSFLAAGERSFVDLLLTPILKAAGAGATALPSYGDYQLELQKDFGPRASFRALFFGSDDALSIANLTPNSSDPSLGGGFHYHTSFWRLQTRFDASLGDRTQLRLVTAYGEDAVSLSLGPLLVDETVHPLTGRAEVSEKIARGLVANAGADIEYEPYDLALQLPPPTRPGVPSGGPGQPPVFSKSSHALFLPAAYADLEITPWNGTRIVPGVRADYDDAIKAWDVAPRINVRQAIASTFPRTTLKGGIGVYDQPPSPLDTDPRLGQLGLRSNRSWQTDVGLEQEFTRHLDLSVDGFYKRMDRLVVAGAGNAGRGFAYGVEWLLRYKPDEHFYGWLSYTFSRSERSDVPGQPYYLFQYDQTHVLTVLGSYKLPRGWQVGLRFRLTSGDLYTPTGTGAYDATSGSQLGVDAVPPFASRFQPFEQLDVRLDKVWKLKYVNLNWYLDVQNIYDAQNPFTLSYNYNYTRSAPISGIPILPIMGIRADLLP